MLPAGDIDENLALLYRLFFIKAPDRLPPS